MFSFIKLLLKSSLIGLLGYIISILFVIFVRLINYTIVTQSQNIKSDFLATIIYVVSHRLTTGDFTLAFFGFLITTFISLLWLLENGKRYF